MNHYKHLLIGCIMGVVTMLSADSFMWKDDFDQLEPKRWEVIPRAASLVAENTLSRGNQALRLSPENPPQQYLVTKERFVNGECEVRFKVKIPKSGNLFYYIGFHDYKPWLKSVCWILIHNNTVKLVIRTPQGAKFSKDICQIRSGQYYILKITRDTGKLRVLLDNKELVIDNPELLTNAPMPFFLGANTPKGASFPAELEVDYVTVSGEGVEKRLTARPLGAEEKKVLDSLESGKLSLHGGKNIYSLDFNGGCHWGEVRYDGKNLIDSNVFMPCFAVFIDGKLFYSHDFKVHKIEKNGDRDAHAELIVPDSKIIARLSLKTGENGDLRTKLKLINRSEKKVSVQSIFPIVGAVAPDGDWKNAEYFFPWRGGLLGRPTARLMTEYGGLGWMQIMWIRNPLSGNGLYFYPEDSTGIFKGMIFNKIDKDKLVTVQHTESVVKTAIPHLDLLEGKSGIAAAYYYAGVALSPGENHSSSETLFSTWNGSLFEPLKRYAHWMRGHLKPVKAPRWFRDTFTWKCSHPGAFFDKSTGQYSEAKRLAGGEDSVQWAFWDDYIEYPAEQKLSQLARYQPGDFEVNRSRGGVPALKTEFEKLRALGVNPTFYIDHRFCWKDCKTGRLHGKEWATCDPNVKFYGYTAPDDLYMMCFYDHDKWVAYVRDACSRLIKTTGCKGIYLDELGIAFPCYNPLHEHFKRGAFPVDPRGLGKSMQMIRNAMLDADPEAALMTEHAGSDYLSQFFDGSWDQTFFQRFDFVEKYFDNYKLCFFRFLFPHFKISEWGASKWHAKRCFFNGIGMDMGGDKNTDIQRILGRVLKENGDAVASLSPEALVKTTHPELLANRFEAPGKVFFTLFNTSQKTITGGVTEIVPDGWHMVELICDENVGNDKEPMRLKLAPGEVAGVAFYPRLLSVKKSDGKLYIEFPPESGDKIIICFGKDDSCFFAPRGKSITLTPAEGKVSYAVPVGSKKLIIKLFKNDYLVDENILK